MREGLGGWIGEVRVDDFSGGFLGVTAEGLLPVGCAVAPHVSSVSVGMFLLAVRVL